MRTLLAWKGLMIMLLKIRKMICLGTLELVKMRPAKVRMQPPFKMARKTTHRLLLLRS